MLLELKNPASWLKADVKELHTFAVQLDTTLQYKQEIAKQLEQAGASNAAKSYRLREKLDDVDELQKVLDYRIRSERPVIDDIFGKDTISKERLNFAKRYGYPMATVIDEQNKVLEIN